MTTFFASMTSPNNELVGGSAPHDVLLGRDLVRAPSCRPDVALNGSEIGVSIAIELICYAEYTNKLLARVIDVHAALIHRARHLRDANDSIHGPFTTRTS